MLFFYLSFIYYSVIFHSVIHVLFYYHLLFVLSMLRIIFIYLMSVYIPITFFPIASFFFFFSIYILYISIYLLSILSYISSIYLRYQFYLCFLLHLSICRQSICCCFFSITEFVFVIITQLCVHRSIKEERKKALLSPFSTFSLFLFQSASFRSVLLVLFLHLLIHFCFNESIHWYR